MKRPALLLLVVLVAAAPAAAAHGRRTAPKPKLHVVRLHPFTVKGTGFAQHKQVTVTLVSGKRWSTHAKVAASGRFTATIRQAVVAKCSAYTLRAVVPHAKNAVLKVKACGAAKAKKKAGGATGAATASGKSTADVVFGQSVRVVGHGFAKHESLTVTLTANDQTWKRHARASAAGAFTLSLGSPPINSCDQYTLTVVGSAGSSFTTTHAAVPC